MADDNSLLIALNELKDIETQRIAGERAAEAKAEQEAAEASARQAAFEAAQEAERKAIAEAKARLALEAEGQASAEAEAARVRLEALQSELKSIQAERRVLHERVLLAADPVAPAPSRSPWPVAFAASTAIAMALGAWLFVRGPEVQVREVLVPVPAPVAALETPVVEAPPVVEAGTAVDEPAVAAPPQRPRADPRPARPARPRPQRVTPGQLADLDCDEDDPLCGL